MKRVLLLLICIGFIMINLSFKKNLDEWGSWTVVAASYNGIEARVKKGDYNDYAKKYHWEIQFRNRYIKSVVFNYDLTARNESGSCDPDKRKDLESGETSDVTAFLVNDNAKVHVCIGDVKIGN